MAELRPWEEIWWVEGQARSDIDPKTICHFGIKHLDDQIPGILKNDLIVIGADSGVGKSEFAINMAVQNAADGKHVALYFIEGGATEAMARMKWKAIKDLYYSKYRCGIEMNYTKWRINAHDRPEMMREIEDKAQEDMKKRIGNRLEIYSFQAGFTIKDLMSSLAEMEGRQSFADIIIIDHLQYFTLVNPKNEYQEMTEILTKVKDVTNHRQIPVVLVSHLRKKEKDRGLPSQEDFFGTSNTAKICSMAITISPFSSKDNYSDELYPTFFRVVKSRVGLRTSIATLCNYDFKAGAYQKEYQVYRLRGDLPNEKPLLPSDLPFWARRKDESERTSTHKGSWFDAERCDEGGVCEADIPGDDRKHCGVQEVPAEPVNPEDIAWTPE